MPQHRATRHLHAASGFYPQATKAFAVMYAGRGADLPEWPSWCLLPMAGWYSIVSADVGEARLRASHALISDVARLAAIGTWRYTQGVYAFDDNFGAAVGDSRIDGDLPCDALMHLPQWCCYVDSPWLMMGPDRVHGFFVHLEWDVNTGRRELRFVLDMDEALLPAALHLGDWSLSESIDRVSAEARRQSPWAAGFTSELERAGKPLLQELMTQLVSLTLYLCSDAPEIDNARTPGTWPQNPRPKKTKRGFAPVPPTKPTTWNVGASIGATLRQAAANATTRNGGVRPHVRRAHWHGYWTGKGRTEFKYKWVAPTFVAS